MHRDTALPALAGDLCLPEPLSQPHHPTVSATEPDWSREHKRWWEWNPSRSLLASIRSFQRVRGPLARPIKLVALLRHRFWSVITGADIPIVTRIGGGLVLPHPNGVVIHRNAVIGPNCLILQQVTIGQTDGDVVPRIGGHVDIGAGAKVIGPVTLGDHACIGANAVVLQDVPTHMTAVGVPARLKAKALRLPRPNYTRAQLKN
jgi:serine O-acetyltransferase